MLKFAANSGDDHDYCENFHHIPEDKTPTREVSVKSLSMAMGIKQPGFHLLSLAPREEGQAQKTTADVPCFLPDQIAIYLSIYVPLLVISIVIVLVSNTLRRYASGASLPVHHRRSSSANSQSEEDSDGTDYSQYNLPHPVSVMPLKSSARRIMPCSWTFVLFGRRRRLTIKTPSRASLSNAICSRPRNQHKRRRQSLLFGCFLDTRDVAVFPLTLFVVISVWISI